MVKVVDAGNDLLEEVPGFILPESPVIAHAVKELTARSIFHDYGKMSWGEEDLPEIDDVRMLQHPMARYFSLHIFIHLPKGKEGKALIIIIEGYIIKG